MIGNNKTISDSSWPTYDESKTIDDEIELPIQINGKLKGTVSIAIDSTEDVVKNLVHEKISGQLEGKQVVKEIYVKNRVLKFNCVNSKSKNFELHSFFLCLKG